MQRILIMSCVCLLCIASTVQSTYSYAQDDRFRDERRPAPTELPPPRTSPVTMDRKVCIADCAEKQRDDRLACQDLKDSKQRHTCKDTANEASDQCRTNCRLSDH